MTLTDEQIEDLRRRASIVSGMLQMGEPVSFGSDSGMIDELLSALEAEKKRADEAEAEIERLLMRDDPVFAYSFMKRAHKSETELTRLREEIEQYREAARGQVVIVNTASSRIKELEAALKLAAEMLTKASLCYAERIDEGLSVIRRALKGGVSEPSAPSEWQKRGPDFNEWEIEWERFAAMLADAKGEYFWIYDGALKYLNIRLDTRSNAFILRDRDDNCIDPARVEAAIRQCRDMRGGVAKIDRDGRRAALKGASHEQG